ncbi:MAG: hypothetical protein HYZ26_12390 [Chloroflexi bacterium]|nr:hypothetical protein [Chloroflexota bacterium]
MAENPLVKKLRLKPGLRAAIINAPTGYLAALQPLPEDVAPLNHLEGQFDWIQIFVKDRAAADALIPSAAAALKPISLLWVSFPKGTSGIQTDLTRDRGWDALIAAGLKWINLISVDDTWSAFAVRPYKPGEPHKTWF